jgi:hypothetical protein
MREDLPLPSRRKQELQACLANELPEIVALLAGILSQACEAFCADQEVGGMGPWLLWTPSCSSPRRDWADVRWGRWQGPGGAGKDRLELVVLDGAIGCLAVFVESCNAIGNFITPDLCSSALKVVQAAVVLRQSQERLAGLGVQAVKVLTEVRRESNLRCAAGGVCLRGRGVCRGGGGRS